MPDYLYRIQKRFFARDFYVVERGETIDYITPAVISWKTQAGEYDTFEGAKMVIENLIRIDLENKSLADTNYGPEEG